MKLGRAVTLLALALGLGGCATYYDEGVSYDDGSYYSPADSGRGDYYYAPEPSYNRYYYDEFDRFFFDSSYYGFGSFGSSWYGSPLYSYGGYCSARYRYCPPFGYYDPFYDPFPRFGLSIYFGDPWYSGYGDGYGYGYGQGYRHPPRHRQPGNTATPPPADDASGPDGPTTSATPWIPRNDQDRIRRGRPRPNPMADDDGAFREPGPMTGEAGEQDESAAPVRRWRGVSPPATSRSQGNGRASSPPPPRSVAPAARERSSDSSSNSSSDDPPPPRRARSRRDDGN